MKKLILLSVIPPLTMGSCFFWQPQNAKVWIEWQNEKRDTLYPHVHKLFLNSTEWSNIISDGIADNGRHHKVSYSIHIPQNDWQYDSVGWNGGHHRNPWFYEGKPVQKKSLAINNPNKINDDLLFDDQFRLGEISVSYYSSGKDWSDFHRTDTPQEIIDSKKAFIRFEMNWYKLRNSWDFSPIGKSENLFVDNDNAYFYESGSDNFVNVSVDESKTYISKILDNDVIKRFMDIQKEIDYHDSAKNSKVKSMSTNSYYKSTQDNILLSSPVNLDSINKTSQFGFQIYDIETKYAINFDNWFNYY